MIVPRIQFLKVHVDSFNQTMSIEQAFQTSTLLLSTNSVEGEWEYFFAHFRKGVKSFKKGLRMKFGYLEGQFIDFMEDSGG